MATAWRLQCIAIGLVVASSVAAHATDIYVDNLIGDDRSSGHSSQIGTSASGPVRSLNRALQLARAGDRIVMAKHDEPYRESVTLQGGRHSGSPNLPLTIEGNGAVLDGRGVDSPREWAYVGDDTYRFTPNWRSFPLLYLGDRPAVRKRADESGMRPALGPLEWCSYKGEVLFRAEPGRMPVEYPLTAPTLVAGLTLYDVRHVIVQDLVVQGFRLDGINCHDNAMDV
ncbi:MAG TPA: hypothetical protein PLV92_30585, partial [Pirellulaceae bacterium]|nr:hypothetical protein [Pirellulaceae bacterium]